MQQQDSFSGLPCGLSSVNDAGDATALSGAKMRLMQQQDRFSGLPCGLSSVNDAGEGSTVQCENAGDAATGALSGLTVSMMWMACHVVMREMQHCPVRKCGWCSNRSLQWLDGLNDVDDAAARPLQWLAMWTVQCK